LERLSDRGSAAAAGLRRARDEGKQLGRPKIGGDLEAKIAAALRRNDRPGVRVIASRFGVSPNTAHAPITDLDVRLSSDISFCKWRKRPGRRTMFFKVLCELLHTQESSSITR
jgi:hypothetical protein